MTRRTPQRIRPMTPGIPRAARIRAYLAALVVIAGLSGVAWRAWALQVGDGDRYRAIAAKQHALTVGIPAPRGDVVDARGRPLVLPDDDEARIARLLQWGHVLRAWPEGENFALQPERAQAAPAGLSDGSAPGGT